VYYQARTLFSNSQLVIELTLSVVHLLRYSRCLELLQNSPTVDTLDLTGGAPELNAQFRFLVKMAREWANENKRKLTIIDRCNLTVLLEPGQEDLVDFLKENRVKVVASLPCYGETNVDAQRGMS